MALRKIRSNYGKKKIRIGFLVSEIAKWKGQSVYDLMVKTKDFEPVVLLFPSSHELKNEADSLNSLLDAKLAYFKKENVNATIVWDIINNHFLPVKSLGVDIVFYQQPWDYSPSCFIFSKYALTFYFPYYMVNNFQADLEIKKELHKTVYRYIVQNEKQASFYKKHINSFIYAGKIVGLGNPIADTFYLNKNYIQKKNYVIYAPHFSFMRNTETQKELPYYSSTFLENGKFLLDFAKQHREINWVFKPHPRLRYELVDYGGWSDDDVDAYYREWEQIGLASYDSKYVDIFLESKAMITDSSSFLTEYSCTGKPLIRLVPGDGHTLLPPNPILKDLYNTFYQSHNNSELSVLLESVILDNVDPNKNRRLDCLRSLGFSSTYAAGNIIEYIRELIYKR